MGREERAAFGAIKGESEVLEPRFKELLEEISEQSSWGKSVSCWQKISEWIEDNYYEEHDQLQIPNIIDSHGFTQTGQGGKSIKCNYL